MGRRLVAGVQSVAFVAVFIFFTCGRLSAQQHLKPGLDRWTVKTSLPANSKKRSVPLRDLLTLPNPIKTNRAKYDTTRIPYSVGTRSLKEGDIITTKGWLHLVALEDDQKTHRDGDYHIQIRTSPEWADTCLVVEVPYPAFVRDPKLAKECNAVRQFIKVNLLNGKEPTTGGNKLSSAVYVTVRGQLFFDAAHLKGKPRGKRNMKSYTPWEIHPVISIGFAPKPK